MSLIAPSGQRPTIAIVGRPNVGKSTLFNRLTRSRDALVADVPGLTRDPKVGIGRVGEAGYIVIDTGGIDETAADQLSAQSRHALAVARECTAVILGVDARRGMNASDETLARERRKLGAPVALAVNKAEGLPEALISAEFQRLGFAPIQAISAAHGDGVVALIEAITEGWPAAATYAEGDAGGRTRIAVLGRPNVGKSTLVNRILGEERMIVADLPGTTRDSVDSRSRGTAALIPSSTPLACGAEPHDGRGGEVQCRADTAGARPGRCRAPARRCT